MKWGTSSRATSLTNAESEPDEGCAFVLDRESRTATGQTCCAAPRRPGLLPHPSCAMLSASGKPRGTTQTEGNRSAGRGGWRQERASGSASPAPLSGSHGPGFPGSFATTMFTNCS